VSAVAATPLPARHQIENWSVAHLQSAAAQWGQWADESDKTFDQHVEHVGAPGGTEWTGRAADAAYNTAGAARDTVRSQSSIKRECAHIANRGAENIAAAQRVALQAISDAEADGFRVGEDLSVTDPQAANELLRASPARSQALTEHADMIRWRAGDLIHTETKLASDLTAKASELDATKVSKGIGAQPVDFRGAPLPMDHSKDRPWEYNLDLTSGNNIDTQGYPSAGAGVSLDDVWKELHRCFNCNFPIGGAPKEFPKVGDKLPLSVGMGSAGPNMPFPVQVTQVTKTAQAIDIEFVTLPGHVDGDGSTIHFRFYEDGGQLHLGVRGLIAHGPGAIEDFPRNITAPAERLGYTAVAHLTWQPYIDRLTANIAAAKGLPIYEPPVGPGTSISVPTR